MLKKCQICTGETWRTALSGRVFEIILLYQSSNIISFRRGRSPVISVGNFPFFLATKAEASSFSNNEGGKKNPLPSRIFLDISTLLLFFFFFFWMGRVAITASLSLSLSLSPLSKWGGEETDDKGRQRIHFAVVCRYSQSWKS